MFEILVNLALAGLFFSAQGMTENSVYADLDSRLRLPAAEMREMESAPQKIEDTDSVGVKITAESFLAIDEATGRVLYEKASGDKRSIASLTKLMTALVFLDHNPGWDTTMTISAEDCPSGGINRLMPGEKISVRDIFNTALIASANEAALTLAKSTGLSREEFVRAMNEKAATLGMTDTIFADPAGLNTENCSTARDISILVRTALDESAIFSALNRSSYQIAVINKGLTRKVDSTDQILNQNFGSGDSVYRVEAGKTGYLEKAGYCFASRVTDDDGRKVITVVLGSATANSRFSDTKSLAYWVFNNYSWP